MMISGQVSHGRHGMRASGIAMPDCPHGSTTAAAAIRCVRGSLPERLRVVQACMGAWPPRLSEGFRATHAGLPRTWCPPPVVLSSPRQVTMVWCRPQ